MRPLGRWMRRSPGHLRFAWVAHPLERAYRVLTDQILRPAGASFPRLRRVLARDYGVDLPEIWPSPGFDAAAAHTALIGFLRFVVANHARQTVVNVNARWASQAAWLDGLPSMLRPHHVFRGRRIANGLAFLEVERDLQPIAVTGAGPGADPMPQRWEISTMRNSRPWRGAPSPATTPPLGFPTGHRPKAEAEAQCVSPMAATPRLGHRS
ncbi:MAG: hypothetical protein JKP98_11075 [Rhodobacteraceae bacterium]|nr:hypothetical protein [Paracoccaceae bacterium]